MAPRTSATRTQISRTPRRFGTELPVYLSPPQWAEREAAGFATRNGFKSTKRQTPSSSIASYDASPTSCDLCIGDKNLALFSKPLMKIKNFLALFRKWVYLPATRAASFLRVWILSNSAIAWFSILFIMASYRIWFSSPSDVRKR